MCSCAKSLKKPMRFKLGQGDLDYNLPPGQVQTNFMHRVPSTKCKLKSYEASICLGTV